MSKALDISSATAQVAPDLLKALSILSGTTVRRSAVDHVHTQSNLAFLTIYENTKIWLNSFILEIQEILESHDLKGLTHI